jgi:hypothetical protein
VTSISSILRSQCRGWACHWVHKRRNAKTADDLSSGPNFFLRRVLRASRARPAVRRSRHACQLDLQADPAEEQCEAFVKTHRST